MRQSAGKTSRAFTLLEVILALAILGLALATLGHTVRVSHQLAERSALESDATIIAESVLDELAAGVRQLIEVVDEPWLFDELNDPLNASERWLVSVEVENGPLEGMLAVRVRVRPEAPLLAGVAPVEIVRWMSDPQLATEEEL